MKYKLGLLLLIFFAVSAYAHSAAASQGNMYPGFKTIGVWQADKKLHLDANVWYPSIRAPFTVTYGPWILNVARNGKEHPGRFPLLIISHDSPGDRFSYHDTASNLARRGFVVAALTHSGDNINSMSKPFTLQQLTNRVRQISGFINALMENHDIAPMIDEKRIGIIGFGTGATAALMAGGALLDSAGWKDYCSSTDESDPYCSDWAVGRINKMAEALPMKESLADVRIKAVAAVAPSFGMLFSNAGMRFFYPPLLIIRADRDTVNHTPQHADAILHQMPKPAHFATLAEADGADLMAECPPPIKNDLPEMCGRATPEKRYKIHQQMQNMLANFFLGAIGDTDNIPHIPAPPVFATEPAKPAKSQNNAVKPPPAEKKKKRPAPPKPPATAPAPQ